MSRLEAIEEYQKALKLGQKEVRECQAKGRSVNPEVLHQVAGELAADKSISVGLVEIPANRIVGTKTAGRISAFSPGFMPLLAKDTEFAVKWIELCTAHLSEGIRDPIVCYEYYGNFYVQEGNKRVSVLKYYESPRIPGIVHRVMPEPSEEPRYKAYLEFLEFFKCTKMYDIQFTAPGCYAKLCQAVGIPMGEVWKTEDIRRLRAYFQYFREAYYALGGQELSVSPEHAMLVFLEVYDYADLGKFSAAELKDRLQKTWKNVEARSFQKPAVKTEPPTGVSAAKLLTKIIGADHLNVAFVHNRTEAASPWTRGHEAGRKYLEEALGKSVTCRSYFGADTPERGEAVLMDALRDGAEVIFTTTPLLIAPSLKISVKFPKVRILNCSLHMPYSTVRTYYPRVYEAKFITGAIAGAMARNNRIGYVGTYPIHGEPAAINAFALGAQLTNPRAKIELKWSCLKGNPSRELFDSGIRVISNRDTPDADRIYTDYGTYFYNEEGKAVALGSPVWKWGKFYEQVIESITDGSWDSDKSKQAVNYWWGIKSGVIDVALTGDLPLGVRHLAEMLRGGLRQGTLDPFLRPIYDQQGVLRTDGTRGFTPDELMHMDWLCENVVGHIPTLEEVIPASRATVQLLGVFQEDLP
ncbi:MAG: BMP family ABC transporter substrate-binding protein [Oscillospiraceae bacterium]|nr:BMP family ABC transporter substrate-binding protein [Oscillospiraceae bacterium]